MSKFTTQLRFICESFILLNKGGQYSEQGDYSDVEDALEAGYQHIFDFTFPFYDSTKRESFCKMILLHYYTRELGYETYALWKLHLRAKLIEIMPKYNRLYQLEDSRDINLFYNNDYGTDTTGTDHRTGSGTRNGESTANGTAKNTNRYSDTPQGGLNGIEANNYLTNATIDDNTTTQTGTDKQTVSDTSDGRNESHTTIKGKNGGASWFELMNDFASKYTSVNDLVLRELDCLFMNLWE